jgi:hypothetical protein
VSRWADRRTGWFFAAYAGAAGFFLVEWVARQRGKAGETRTWRPWPGCGKVVN